MLFDKRETVMSFGILYTEDEYMTAHSVWYDTEKKREEIMEYALSTGLLPLTDGKERTVRVRAVSRIYGDGTYYRR